MMAIDGLIPRRIGTINVAGAPWVAQLISTSAIQIFIVVFYINEASYAAMVQLARALPTRTPERASICLGRIFPDAKTGTTLASR